MEHDQKVELIDLAIQKLIQDNRITINDKRSNDSEEEEEECVGVVFLQTNDNEDEAEYQLALSQLLSASQLELLKRDDQALKQSKASIPSEAASVVHNIESENMDAGEADGKCNESETDEVVKELKKVKRQNFVTHCLLSVMIVITVAWQLSEVSLLLKVKDGINHPFRSFKSMLKGMVKVPDMNGQEGDNKEQQSESPSPPSLIPEMPQLDLANLGLHNGKE